MTVVQIKHIYRFTLEDDVTAAVMQCRVLCGGDTSAGITMMHASTPMGTTFNNFYSFTQGNLQMGLISNKCCIATNIWRP
jgi:hypothetical protein